MSFVSAATLVPDNGTYLRPEEKLLNPVQVAQISFCCEKTTDGVWCQNNPEANCDSGFRKNAASCEATSFCKLGCCFDSTQGVCMENTPEKTCVSNGGNWADSASCDIPQCKPGCCIIGDQAAFVTLTRCKKLSSFYGLELNFKKNVNNELSCISLAQTKDEGACVYAKEEEFGFQCKYTTRGDCAKIVGNSASSNQTTNKSVIGFHKDYLCSAEEFGTNCAKTRKTTCVDKLDGVYFVDSCGNVANIYDASKVDDREYWTKKVEVKNSCKYGVNNANSQTCGNCNYIQGSICAEYNRKRDKVAPSMGDNICRDLNCPATVTSDGKAHKHGESWCSGSDGGDMPGARYFRHLCIQGEEMIEPCADYRQEICIQNTRSGFTEAGCRVNRWQDCWGQTTIEDCENTDKRDCRWIEGGVQGLIIGGGNTGIAQQAAAPTGTSATPTTGETANQGRRTWDEEDGEPGVCVPMNPPGYEFWNGGGSTECGQASVTCTVKYKEETVSGLFSKSKSKKCTENCECDNEEEWVGKLHEICVSLGDCGEKVNYVGREGFVSKDTNKDGSPSVASSGSLAGSKNIFQSSSGSNFYSSASSPTAANSGSSAVTSGGNSTA